MTAQEVIDELMTLVHKHGDKIIFADGFEVIDIDYNVADDCYDIN